MKKYGGFIPGIRPGRSTADYLNKIMTRITLVRAIFLAVIAVLPEYYYCGDIDEYLFWWNGLTDYNRCGFGNNEGH